MTMRGSEDLNGVVWLKKENIIKICESMRKPLLKECFVLSTTKKSQKN